MLALGIICINCLNPLFFSIYQKKPKQKPLLRTPSKNSWEADWERKNYSSILRNVEWKKERSYTRQVNLHVGVYSKKTRNTMMEKTALQLIRKVEEKRSKSANKIESRPGLWSSRETNWNKRPSETRTKNSIDPFTHTQFSHENP